MSEQTDKTPEQVSDEDYKVAPTSFDEKYLNKRDRRVPGVKRKLSAFRKKAEE